MREHTLLIATLCIVSWVGITTAQQAVQKNNAKAPAAPVIVKTYALRDLPIWTEKGEKFDPSILVAYLGSRIAPEKLGKQYTFFPRSENAALIVSAPQAAHEEIAAILTDLRNQ